jgi:hypothetical protein
LHAIGDDHGRPTNLMLSEGQLSDHRGARLRLPLSLPARELVADRGYESNHFPTALVQRGITPAFPPHAAAKRRVARLPPPGARATGAAMPSLPGQQPC